MIKIVRFRSSLVMFQVSIMLSKCIFYSSVLLGVGKTSLVHLIMTGSSIAQPSQTIGCSVDVKVIAAFCILENEYMGNTLVLS